MLKQARILIVEDEPLIAMELARVITDAGGTVVAMLRTESEACAFAGSGQIDAAVLDIWIKDGKSYPVAEVLKSRGIPFVFCTADTGEDHRLAAWTQVPVLAKPYRPDKLVALLGCLLSNFQ